MRFWSRRVINKLRNEFLVVKRNKQTKKQGRSLRVINKLRTKKCLCDHVINSVVKKKTQVERVKGTFLNHTRFFGYKYDG